MKRLIVSSTTMIRWAGLKGDVQNELFGNWIRIASTIAQQQSQNDGKKCYILPLHGPNSKDIEPRMICINALASVSVGDMVVSFCGQPILTTTQLANLLMEMPRGCDTAAEPALFEMIVDDNDDNEESKH